MRILILRSRRRMRVRGEKDPYTQTFSDLYAGRVIGNLADEEGFCTACGADCIACRQPYGRRFGESLAGIIDLPGELPYLLENPERYVPQDIPPHEILLAINVHEQILLGFLERCSRRGTVGAVVPVESGEWVSGSARRQAEELCRYARMEVSFPKPFCAFDPPAGSKLAEFRKQFHIGKPSVELTVREGVIERAYVHVSAACGATYYVARHLEGRRADEDLRYDVVSKRLHSYPCTASMAWDEELDDTILHVAGEAHYEILEPLSGPAPQPEPGMVMSPVGRMVQAPTSPRENIENIERAKEAILAALAAAEAVSLADIECEGRLTPAALSSAVLLLKQEGKVRTEAGKIVRP
jgi:hypothetical protein